MSGLVHLPEDDLVPCLQLCLPGGWDCGPLTFLPGSGENGAVAWEAWVKDTWRALLQPAFCGAWSAAARGEFAGVVAVDRALTDRLHPAEARRSLLAGRRILLGYHPPRGAKVLTRMTTEASGSPGFGHLACVFAVRAALFQQPLFLAWHALLLAEVCAALAERGAWTHAELSAMAAAACRESLREEGAGLVCVAR